LVHFLYPIKSKVTVFLRGVDQTGLLFKKANKMIALISDIHANFEALCAVMGDIRNNTVDSVICLGDIVGYGPDPEKCTDLIMGEADSTIMGNHDFALLSVPFGFNPIAAEVIRKTQAIMRPEPGNDDPADVERHYYACSQQKELPRCLVMEHVKKERWEFLQKLPGKIERENVLFVHGSPLDPTFEYILPPSFEKTWNPERMKKNLARVNRVAFCGHTHIPCAITSDLACIYPRECDNRLTLDRNRKYIINTGSVGQPRDRDNRACYLLFDEKNHSIEWRRMEYDIAAVVEKSDMMCGKDNWCGARLWAGK
jgi:predicted phosphodiesterase